MWYQEQPKNKNLPKHTLEHQNKMEYIPHVEPRPDYNK